MGKGLDFVSVALTTVIWNRCTAFSQSFLLELCWVVRTMRCQWCGDLKKHLLTHCNLRTDFCTGIAVSVMGMCEPVCLFSMTANFYESVLHSLFFILLREIARCIWNNIHTRWIYYPNFVATTLCVVKPKLVQFNFLKLLTEASDKNSMLVCMPLPNSPKNGSFHDPHPKFFWNWC